jgi:hypothetical protein
VVIMHVSLMMIVEKACLLHRLLLSSCFLLATEVSFIHHGLLGWRVSPFSDSLPDHILPNIVVVVLSLSL